MSDSRMPLDVSSSTLELVAWVARRPRTYSEAMEAWGSHCPRLTAWEDALLDGLIRVERAGGTARGSVVVVTARGRAALSHVEHSQPRPTS